MANSELERRLLALGRKCLVGKQGVQRRLTAAFANYAAECNRLVSKARDEPKAITIILLPSQVFWLWQGSRSQGYRA